MALVTTDAIVLQLYDYMESSRIVRLATRELGLLSAVAKGARRQRARAGSALDLFVEGTAHVYVKPSRDLHTLGGFEAGPGRSSLAADLHRFMAASAVGEVALRVLHGEPNVPAYEALLTTLDDIGSAPAAAGGGAGAAALRGTWRLLATLGFAPTLDVCAGCHAGLQSDEEPVRFLPEAGGVLCSRCARGTARGRSLPAAERLRLLEWVEGGRAPIGEAPDERSLRAHRRLLREFLDAHLTGDRPLTAWDMWARDP
jgi:DNA repair protein RecO (recombination protein O)